MQGPEHLLHPGATPTLSAPVVTPTPRQQAGSGHLEPSRSVRTSPSATVFLKVCAGFVAVTRTVDTVRDAL